MANTIHDISIVRATIDDVPAVLDLLDTAVKWLVSNGETGQWGTAPFSENPKRHKQLTEYATTGQGLWLAVETDAEAPVIMGALAIGDKMDYVPAIAEDELYVRLLITDRKWAGKGIGKRLLDHARHLAIQAGILLLRVDCYAGGDGKLVRYYESQGFERSESLKLEGHWPCQVLIQRLGK